MPSFDFRTPEEVVGEIYDIPESLLIKENFLGIYQNHIRNQDLHMLNLLDTCIIQWQ